MASLRTSLVLVVLAGALFAFIFWFERGSPSSGELERRKGSALPGFVRDHVTKLEIQHAGKLTVLSRDSSDDESEHAWHVQAPFRAAADREVVDSVLSDLEFMDAKRRLEGISAADRKSFGFDRPRFRVWFTLGSSRLGIAVGNESPRGDGVYVEGATPGTAFVVDKKLAQTLAQEPGAYHAKQFLPDLRSDKVSALSVRDEHGERALRRVGEQWTLTTPGLGLASTQTASELINALDALRAKHFVVQAPSAAELAGYGLAQPRLQLSLSIPGAAAKGSKTPSPVAAAGGTPVAASAPEQALGLKVGKPCAQYPGESYASPAADGPVMCVLDADLAKLQPALAELRERRLLPLESEEAITSLQLERAGARLVLSKGGSGWAYETSRDGQTQLKGTARSEAVSEWLDALRAAKAERWENGDLSGLQAAELIALRVERKDKPPYQAQIEAAASGPRVRRASEPELGVFPAATLQLLAPSAARFRTLELARVPETALREIEIRRAGQAERLARRADGAPFSIVAPLQATADPVRLGELVRLLGALEAVRFVADAPTEAHGLASPQSQLSVDYEASGKDAPRQRLALRVGAATDGGHFAQLEGQPGVFVVPTQLADLLAEPLVTRTALAIPLEQIRAAVTAQAGRTLRVERRGQDFIADGTGLQPELGRELVEALATLRASAVSHYGAALPSEGMEHPYARIEVTTQSGEARTFMLGAPSGSGRYARRSDMQVSFIVPSASVEGLLRGLEATRKKAL